MTVAVLAKHRDGPEAANVVLTVGQGRICLRQVVRVC